MKLGTQSDNSCVDKAALAPFILAVCFELLHLMKSVDQKCWLGLKAVFAYCVPIPGITQIWLTEHKRGCLHCREKTRQEHC